MAVNTAVIAGTATAVSGRVARRQEAKYEAQAAAQQPQAAPPPDVAEPAAAPAADPMEQLQKLAALHEQGILTDEEFAAKKTQLLAEM